MKKILYKLGQLVSAVSVAVIIVITVADVLMRYFLNKSIFGAAEGANMLLAILVGAGMIVVSKERLHITVDLFRPQLEGLFRGGYQKWISFCEVLGTFVLAVIVGNNALHVLRSKEQTAVLEFPIGWVYAAVAVLIAFALIVLIAGDDENASDLLKEKL